MILYFYARYMDCLICKNTLNQSGLGPYLISWKQCYICIAPPQKIGDVCSDSFYKTLFSWHRSRSKLVCFMLRHLFIYCSDMNSKCHEQFSPRPGSIKLLQCYKKGKKQTTHAPSPIYSIGGTSYVNISWNIQIPPVLKLFRVQWKYERFT